MEDRYIASKYFYVVPSTQTTDCPENTFYFFELRNDKNEHVMYYDYLLLGEGVQMDIKNINGKPRTRFYVVDGQVCIDRFQHKIHKVSTDFVYRRVYKMML